MAQIEQADRHLSMPPVTPTVEASRARAMGQKGSLLIVVLALSGLLIVVFRMATDSGDGIPPLIRADEVPDLAGRIYFETLIPGSQIHRPQVINPDGSDVQRYSGVLADDSGTLWEAGCEEDRAYSPDRTRFVYRTCECKEGKDISGGNIPVDCKYGLWVAAADGSEATLLASADEPDSLFIRGLSWSPDGTCFAVALAGDIWLLDDAWRVNLTQSAEVDENPRWLADAEPSP